MLSGIVVGESITGLQFFGIELHAFLEQQLLVLLADACSNNHKNNERGREDEKGRGQWRMIINRGCVSKRKMGVPAPESVTITTK